LINLNIIFVRPETIIFFRKYQIRASIHGNMNSVMAPAKLIPIELKFYRAILRYIQVMEVGVKLAVYLK